MAAEDFADSHASASTIYECIRSRLVDRTSPGISSPDRKLPLVYVLDSLIKNVKGEYIKIIQDGAVQWMPEVYDILDKAGKDDAKARLKKVWNTWKVQGVITDEEKWRQIGQCFVTEGGGAKDASKTTAEEPKSSASGIGRRVSLHLFKYLHYDVMCRFLLLISHLSTSSLSPTDLSN
jgi:pre-mRNA cleavage complex 2 protein Pcf11